MSRNQHHIQPLPYFLNSEHTSADMALVESTSQSNQYETMHELDDEIRHVREQSNQILLYVTDLVAGS